MLLICYLYFLDTPSLIEKNTGLLGMMSGDIMMSQLKTSSVSSNTWVYV